MTVRATQAGIHFAIIQPEPYSLYSPFTKSKWFVGQFANRSIMVLTFLMYVRRYVDVPGFS